MTTEFKPRGIRASHALGYKDLEAEAWGLRKVLQLAPDARFPCSDLFESLQEFAVEGISLTYGVADLDPAIEGKTRYCRDAGRIEVLLSPATYDGMLADHPRARFSVVHEIGHAVLHSDELIALSELHPSVGLTRGHGHRAFEDTEWQADGFAAAALMPAPALADLYAAGDLRASVLAEQFGASIEAAHYRIDNFLKRGEALLRATRT